MATEQILQMLILERDKLNRAIEALSAGTKRRGRPPKAEAPDFSDPSMPDWVKPASAKKKPGRKKRTFTAEQREAQAEKMKAYWAKRKKAGKKKA